MMHKIMAEASRSIIGMLSAKPDPMETRTAYNHFSVLLNPGDDRVRPALDSGTTDLADDNRGEQPLDQFMDDEAAPVPSASNSDIAKTVAKKVFPHHSAGDISQASDISQSSSSVSDTDRFISQLLPAANRPVGNQSTALADQKSTMAEKALLQANPSTVGNYQSGLSVDQSASAGETIAPVQVSLPSPLPAADRQSDEPKKTLGEVAKVASIPLIFVDGPMADNRQVNPEVGDLKQSAASNAAATKTQLSPELAQQPVSEKVTQTPVENKLAIESKSPAAFKPALESAPSAETKNVETIPVTKTGLSDAMALANSGIDKPMATKPLSAPPEAGKSQDLDSERKISDLLNFRSANKHKADALPQRIYSENGDVAPSVSGEKPIRIENKPSFAEMESRSGAAALNSDVELVAPVSSSPVTGIQNSTQRTVVFDWNAPQFAERFASEIRDLTISGDLKKFEINPRNMGRLEVSLITRGQMEIIQIEAESNAVRDVIAQNSQAIQEMLKGQGRSDLQLRIDVRENAAFASPNDGMNFGQQDSPAAQEDRPRQSQSQGPALASASETGPQIDSDNSRYA